MSEFDSDWEPELRDGGSRSWSGWRHAYRFVTDGVDIVAELEDQTGGEHGRGHPEMSDEFVQAFPKRHGRPLVQGWLIPTANGRAYGFLHYGGAEYQLDEAYGAAAKFLAKPVHLLEAEALSDQAWQDPERYAIYAEGGAMTGFNDTIDERHLPDV